MWSYLFADSGDERSVTMANEIFKIRKQSDNFINIMEVKHFKKELGAHDEFFAVWLAQRHPYGVWKSQSIYLERADLMQLMGRIRRALTK